MRTWRPTARYARTLERRICRAEELPALRRCEAELAAAAAALQPLAADGGVCDAVAAWLAPDSTHPLGELLRRRAAEFDLTYARASTNPLSPSRSRSEPTATSPSTPAVKRVTTAREAAAAEAEREAVREAIGDVHATVALLQSRSRPPSHRWVRTLTRRRSSASGRGRRRSCTNSSLPSTAPPSSRTARRSAPSTAQSVRSTTILRAAAFRALRRLPQRRLGIDRLALRPPPVDAAARRAALGVAAAAPPNRASRRAVCRRRLAARLAARHASRRPRRWRRASCRRLGCRTRRRRRLANESTSRPNRS